MLCNSIKQSHDGSFMFRVKWQVCPCNTICTVAFFAHCKSANNLFQTMAPFWFLHSTGDLCVRCWKFCDSEETYPCRCEVASPLPYEFRLKATWGFFDSPLCAQQLFSHYIDLPTKPLSNQTCCAALILHNPTPSRGIREFSNFLRLPEIEG